MMQTLGSTQISTMGPTRQASHRIKMSMKQHWQLIWQPLRKLNALPKAHDFIISDGVIE